MKKVLCFLLVLTMCLPCMNFVFADDGDKAGELILSVKQKFDIDDEIFVLENYNKQDYDGKIVHYISWISRDKGEYSFSPDINVKLEDSGEVESYRMGKPYTSETVIPQFSQEQFIEKATEFISVITPERASKVSQGQMSDIASGTVVFQRLENSIPVSGDYLSLQLDIETCDLISYSANWTDAQFKAADGIIAPLTAKEYYKSKLGYELLYNIITEKRDIKDIYLSYEPKATRAYIDAFTGEGKIHAGYVFSTAGALMADSVTEESANSKELSPEEQALVDEINKMISKDDAEKIVRNVKEFSVRDDADVTSFSVSKNRYGQYVASISLGVSKKDDFYYAHATINATTKEILAFRESEDHKETDHKYNPEKAKNNAISFLKKYYGEKFGQTKASFTLGNEDEYNFAFDRYVNGTKVKGNGLSVSTNPYTGEISSFNCNWADTQFPSASDVVSIETIYEDVLSDKNLELTYLVAEVYEYSAKDDKEKHRYETHLAYMPKATPTYSAQSGAEIDYAGNPIAKEFSGYDDIEGHYCETAAKELAKAGIYFEGDSLKPNDNATQSEFLKLVLHAVKGYTSTEEEHIYRYCISEGIMPEDEIGSPLTRTTAVRYMVNALGFKDAAEIKGIYKCAFEDVAEDMQGYTAIASGLGIINSSVNLFRPDAVITRAECITMIHNYLK